MRLSFHFHRRYKFREQHHGLVIACVIILNSDWSDSQNEQHSIVTEKTAQAFSAFEALWFLLAFVFIVLCSNQDAFQHSTTKNGFKFCFYMLSQYVFYFYMIISDLHKRKWKLTILIKQEGHESISFLNTRFFWNC